ncbi:hypothetical protein ACFPYI_07870 [Halomarina salina]|uniref:Uncharacterized protein n=1 Tax=Halomarina salina TaxID=1872699 RepID=A0ABD5RKY4_9EURY|nr:hypothetical protein [Halomarina salina]
MSRVSSSGDPRAPSRPNDGTGESSVRVDADETTVGHRPDRWLGWALVALALGVATNSLLGPLVTGAIAYPFPETLVNQTVGLEAVSLAVVAPWSLVAAWFVLRDHRAGPVLALPPAAYTAYMFVQYVVGPEYLTYSWVVAFHLGLFVLSGAVLVRAWSSVRSASLPTPSETRRRRASVGLVLLTAFVGLQYLPAAGGVLTGGPVSDEVAAAPTMYWSIALLDLGVVVPVTVATAIGLLRGASWAERALYGVAGWYLLVPVSVAAMGLTMLANGDPNASVGQVVVLSVAALLFTAFAAWVYRPLFARARDRQGTTERTTG